MRQPLFYALYLSNYAWPIEPKSSIFSLTVAVDCLKTWSKKFTWIETFALKVFALFDVFSCCCCESKLALSVYVDFCNTQRDGSFYLISRDTSLPP